MLCADAASPSSRSSREALTTTTTRAPGRLAPCLSVAVILTSLGVDRVVRGTRTSCRPDPLDARAYVDESAAGDAIAPRRILARGARCAAPSVNLARKIKAKSALLHRQRFVLTKSYVQLNKCYGKLDISEQKDVRFIAELALSTIIAARRKPSSRARETLRRIAIATIFTILKERSLLRKTCQADKIFRETWSKSRTEANCP